MAEWQGFYSTRQVSRLTGIPTSTVYLWRQRGIIRPSLQLIQKGMVADEGYSYADVTVIRVLKALREKQLDFDSAAKALRHMYDRLGPPDKGWANEHVYLVGKRIYVDRPDEWEATDATELGQRVATVLFGDLFDELRSLEEGASILVPPQFRQFISVDPKVQGGEPVIRNTRLPTAVVVSMLAKYGNINRLAKAYSPVPRQSLEKAIEYERYLDERLAS